VIAFPYTERDSVHFNSLLFHEIGHFLFQKSDLQQELTTSLGEMRSKVQQLTTPGMLFDPPTVGAAASENVLTWCQELYCDLVGVTLGGPSYAIAFGRLSRLQGTDAKAERQFTEGYPPDVFRRSCIAKVLEQQGWLKAIEEVDVIGANRDFLEACRADALTGGAATSVITAGSILPMSPIDLDFYEYPIERQDLAKLLVESFFRLAPRLFDAARKIHVHLPNYVEDFRTNYSSVIRSLTHLTVPEMTVSDGGAGPSAVHPVTLLACGNLMLVRDLSEVHHLAGRSTPTVKLVHTLWVEDRLNRLVMKAIEDSLVLRRWSERSNERPNES
jgi:hypothetical protein